MTRTAFITGAASGIGLATARVLYQQGWTLGLADVNTEALHLHSAGWDSTRVFCYALNVTSAEQFRHTLANFALHNNQSLDLLFNCAGILTIGCFQDIDCKRHQQIMDINVMGVINGCQAAFPYLRKTPGALVINMSSASAAYGTPHMASYSASKFAVSGLTEALQLEWEKYGIRVCDVMPPFVSTPMLNDQQQGAPVLTKLGVHLDADDVARVILKQIKAPNTHRTVSLLFGLMYQLQQISPRIISRTIMRLLNH